MDLEEQICRIACAGEGVDPDRESIGCGGVIERDRPYKLWEARRRIAQALVQAGMVFSADTTSTLESELSELRVERGLLDGLVHYYASHGCDLDWTEAHSVALRQSIARHRMAGRGKE